MSRDLRTILNILYGNGRCDTEGTGYSAIDKAYNEIVGLVPSEEEIKALLKDKSTFEYTRKNYIRKESICFLPTEELRAFIAKAIRSLLLKKLEE
jgi:hypothetical protein